MKNANMVKLDGIKDVREAAEAAGLAYKVSLEPLMTAHGPVDTGHKAVVRDDNGVTIGVVGSRYTPVQNHAFLAPLQPLIDDNKIVLSKAYQYDGGRVTMIECCLPEPLRIPAVGKGQYFHNGTGTGYTGEDVILRKILWANSYDGSRQVSLTDAIDREWCSNKATHVLGMSSWGFRHVRSATIEVKGVMAAVEASVLRFEKVAATAKMLTTVEFTQAQMESVAARLYPIPEGEANPTRAMNNREALVSEFHKERRGAFGHTAWDAVNALTAFATHERTTRSGGRDEELSRLKSIFVQGNAWVSKGYGEVCKEAGIEVIDAEFTEVEAEVA